MEYIIYTGFFQPKYAIYCLLVQSGFGIRGVASFPEPHQSRQASTPGQS